MKQVIIDFINENEDLIDDNEWETVYSAARKKLVPELIGDLTMMMLQCEIHPEDHLDNLPAYFLEGSKVSEFNIPNNVTSIGGQVFHKCMSLKSVVIPDSVTSIGDYAFAHCYSLTSVTIPNSVTRIGSYAFGYCSSLLSVTIPDSVTDIGWYAFAHCDSLISVTIPNSVTSMGYDILSGCRNVNIDYSGTKEQWKALSKGKFSGTTYICKCSDGVIKKSR